MVLELNPEIEAGVTLTPEALPISATIACPIPISLADVPIFKKES